MHKCTSINPDFQLQQQSMPLQSLKITAVNENHIQFEAFALQPCCATETEIQ